MKREQLQKRNQEIIDSYKSGKLNIIELGKKYSISKQRISVILIENGLEPSSTKSNRDSKKKINNLTKEVTKLKEKYIRRSEEVRERVGKQRLEILNLKNTLGYREGQIERLKQKIKELEGKLQEGK